MAGFRELSRRRWESVYLMSLPIRWGMGMTDDVLASVWFLAPILHARLPGPDMLACRDQKSAVGGEDHVKRRRERHVLPRLRGGGHLKNAKSGQDVH